MKLPSRWNQSLVVIVVGLLMGTGLAFAEEAEPAEVEKREVFCSAQEEAKGHSYGGTVRFDLPNLESLWEKKSVDLKFPDFEIDFGPNAGKVIKPSDEVSYRAVFKKFPTATGLSEVTVVDKATGSESTAWTPESSKMKDSPTRLSVRLTKEPKYVIGFGVVCVISIKK